MANKRQLFVLVEQIKGSNAKCGDSLTFLNQFKKKKKDPFTLVRQNWRASIIRTKQEDAHPMWQEILKTQRLMFCSFFLLSDGVSTGNANADFINSLRKLKDVSTRDSLNPPLKDNLFWMHVSPTKTSAPRATSHLGRQYLGNWPLEGQSALDIQVSAQPPVSSDFSCYSAFPGQYVSRPFCVGYHSAQNQSRSAAVKQLGT